MRSVPLVAIALVAAALAGCFSDPAPPTERTFSASGGKVSEGYAYDGTGVVSGSATLSGTLNDPDNRGSINVTFDYAGSKWAVALAQFGGTEPFRDGGVRFGFPEHGDSGNGDALLPKMNVKAAAWGQATVTRDGQPVVGAAGNLWTAHIMLSDDTVRGADGKIANAAGAAYNPASPNDARVVAGDPQGLLLLKSPDGETAKRAPLNETKTLAFQGPEAAQNVEIASAKGASALTVNVTVQGVQSSPLAVGQATITLKDAEGNATKTQQLTVTPNAPGSVAWALTAAEIAGAYTLEVKGAGAFTAKVDYAVTYDDKPFLFVTWDEITVS